MSVVNQKVILVFQGGIFFSRSVESSSTESDDCFKMMVFFLSNRSSSSI